MRTKVASRCLLDFLVITALILPISTPANAQNLFIEETPATHLDLSKRTARSKTAKIKADQLMGRFAAAIPVPGQAPSDASTEKITINLFDDMTVQANRTKCYKNESGSSTWVGTIENEPESTVIFVINEDSVYGMIEIPDIGSFSIRPLSDDIHIIEQIVDARMLTGNDDAIEPPANIAPPLQAPIATPHDNGSIIDVYVAYDQDASGGSVSAVEAQSFAELFIAYTNRAYENSNIKQRLWLVGNVDGYNHTDTNPSSLLGDLQAVTGGSISGLHAKRDEYHADLVLFFTPYTGSACHGLAWLQQSNNNIAFESHAYAVMQSCSFGQAVFAHELGHNMGSRHDWYMDDKTSPASIGHGYIDPINHFRTIMSYGNRCDALDTSCPTIPYFSNPEITYNNKPTGVSLNTASDCKKGQANPSDECDADNGSHFDSKALTNSQFRDSRLTWTGAVDSNWTTAANWTINEGSPESATVAHRVPRSYDNVFIPKGLARYPAITGTAKARELTIQKGAVLNMASGTLAIGWRWKDSGGFHATAGTVQLSGPIGMSIISSSIFQNLQIGNGLAATTTVDLQSNLHIDGHFTIDNGSVFNAGSHTLNLAGHWQENNTTGFQADTSTVIFDGNIQSINKVVSQTLLSEDFRDAEGKGCCNTALLPSTWTRESAWFGGEIQGSGRIFAAGNGWLHTPSVFLTKGSSYSFDFDFSQYAGSDTLRAYVGDTAHSSSMTQAIGTIDTTGHAHFTFKVPTSGTYYIGINHDGVSQSYVDNVKLTEKFGLNFYNAHIISGATTFNKDIAIANNLKTENDATANFLENTITVEGSVINNGGLKQSKNVQNKTLTHFMGIKNAAGTSNKYYGLEITPSTGKMGRTEVTINGNKSCAASDVKRCYTITPSISQTASIKFYYQSSEGSGNTSPNLYHQASSAWDAQSATARGGSNNAMWTKVDDVTQNGTFSLSNKAIAPNNAPVATADSYAILNNMRTTIPNSHGVLHNDSDADNNPLTAVLVTNVSHGTLSLNTSGSLSYQPNAGFTGSDHFTYKTSDGMASSNTVTAALIVLANNNIPLAGNDSYTTMEDLILKISENNGLLSNDTNSTGTALSATIVSSPKHGTLTFHASGSFTYRPTHNYNGQDSFTYKANNGDADSNVATVSLVINAVNDKPVARVDSYTTNQNTQLLTSHHEGVLKNDSDAEGDALKAILSKNVRYGTLALKSDGAFMYTPKKGFSGSDSFIYIANDGAASSVATKVDIKVKNNAAVVPLIMQLFHH